MIALIVSFNFCPCGSQTLLHVRINWGAFKIPNTQASFIPIKLGSENGAQIIVVFKAPGCFHYAANLRTTAVHPAPLCRLMVLRSKPEALIHSRLRLLFLPHLVKIDE